MNPFAQQIGTDATIGIPKASSIMPDAEDIQHVVIVGQNRPRLSKIMGMVREKQAQSNGSEFDARTEFVPCLAVMQAYEDGQGNKIRYMANIVYHDGCPMTKFLDDDEFRLSLKLVLMVGYEWNQGDDEHISKYFETSNLPVPVECVQPNSGFDNLQQEMDGFKNLNEEDKQKHLEAQTMGPGKMAMFIINATEALKNTNSGEEKLEDVSDEEKEENKTDAIQEKQEKKQLIINPGLPRFACRMCRTILFGEDHLAKDHVQNLHSFKRANFDARRQTVACQSIFCNEAVLERLSEHGQDIEGKLACPKCEFKIGHWRWSGAQVRINLVALKFGLLWLSCVAYIPTCFSCLINAVFLWDMDYTGNSNSYEQG
jgi:hypothetical protein